MVKKENLHDLSEKFVKDIMDKIPKHVGVTVILHDKGEILYSSSVNGKELADDIRTIRTEEYNLLSLN